MINVAFEELIEYLPHGFPHRTYSNFTHRQGQSSKPKP
jgi:hypothetical protein